MKPVYQIILEVRALLKGKRHKYLIKFTFRERIWYRIRKTRSVFAFLSVYFEKDFSESQSKTISSCKEESLVGMKINLLPKLIQISDLDNFIKPPLFSRKVLLCLCPRIKFTKRFPKPKNSAEKTFLDLLKDLNSYPNIVDVLKEASNSLFPISQNISRDIVKAFILGISPTEKEIEAEELVNYSGLLSFLENTNIKIKGFALELLVKLVDYNRNINVGLFCSILLNEETYSFDISLDVFLDEKVLIRTKEVFDLLYILILNSNGEFKPERWLKKESNLIEFNNYCNNRNLGINWTSDAFRK